jgi:hypothetical protein
MQYAILEQLRSPPAEFKDVIQDHFRCVARCAMLSRMAHVSAFVLGAVAGLLSAIGHSCGTTDCIQRTCMLSGTWSGRLQRDYVVRTCEKWIREVTETESPRAKRMSGHLDQIRSLLAAL